jgi:toxin ParE1/3/4
MSGQAIKKHPLAETDIWAKSAYIARDSLPTARRFLTSVEATLRELARHPELGTLHQTPVPRLAGIRIWAVRKFPNHLIFYRTTDAGIEVVRLLHAAQDWLRILEST